MQAFQLRIDLGGMGGMQGAAMGGGSGGQSVTDGAFAGMVANAGAYDSDAPQTSPAAQAVPSSAQVPAKGIGAENLQVLQPDADAGGLPVESVPVEVAAPLLPESGSDASGLAQGWGVTEDAADDAVAGDAAAGDDADALTGEPPLLMAFAMPAPLPAPQAAVSVPLDGAVDGLDGGADGLDSLEGTDGLRGSIQPFAPSLPQPGSDADGIQGTQPGLAPSGAAVRGGQVTGEPSTGAQVTGAQAMGGQILGGLAGGVPQTETEASILSAFRPQAGADQVQPGAADVSQGAAAQVMSVVSRPAVMPAAAEGLEAALAAAGLTSASGGTVSDDLLKLATMPGGSAAGMAASAVGGQTDASAAQVQNDVQAVTAQQPPVQAQNPVSAQMQTQNLSPELRLAPVDAPAQAASDVSASDAVEDLRFAFASSAGADATAAAAKPEVVAQQAVASSAVTDTSDSLMQTAIDDAVSAREAASTAVAERVEERLADQESSRYKLPSGEGTPLAGQSASARGTQASDLAGVSAAINGAQAAGEAASPDAANADAASDPVVALDGRPGQMDFTGFGRADGATGAMTGTTQVGTASASGQMPTQAQAQAAASQVAGQIQLQSRAGQSRFQMRLDPPELGRIEVHMKVKSGGEVEAHLIVDKPETLDMFMRDQKGLERALEQAGLKADQGALQFSLRDEGSSRQFAFSGDGQGNGSGQSGRQDQQQGQDNLTAEQTMAERVVQLYRQNGRSGVDIRI